MMVLLTVLLTQRSFTTITYNLLQFANSAYHRSALSAQRKPPKTLEKRRNKSMELCWSSKNAWGNHLSSTISTTSLAALTPPRNRRYVKSGSIKGNDPDHRIRFGQLKLAGFVTGIPISRALDLRDDLADLTFVHSLSPQSSSLSTSS
jgi:hypothetical protein